MFNVACHHRCIAHVRLLQAIVADSADGEALDVELSASGFGQHYQEVVFNSTKTVVAAASM